MFSWFRKNPKREIKRLNKDAETIVEMTFQGFGSTAAREVAVQIREYLDQAHELAVGDPPDYERYITEYRRLHKDARDRRDQVRLTSLTLTLIYLRSEPYGAACVPARQAVDDFLAHWAHVTDEDEGESPAGSG